MPPPTRRQALASLAACSAAAHPWLTPVTFAAVPGDNRLVVILLRGAMDGLDVVRPLFEPTLAAVRPRLMAGAAAGAAGHDLGGGFALHPALAGLMPLWQAGELAFVHAVSTPYRHRRSHFDGQDLLENGGPDPDGALTPARDGWLNRMLGAIPGASRRTALAVGPESPLILRGAHPTAGWAPEAGGGLSGAAWGLVERLYAGDPLFLEAGRTARDFARRAGEGARERDRAVAFARLAAAELRRDSRIAAFSLGGWDTHRGQDRTLARPLGQLAGMLTTLRADLGADWQRTAVLALTEFGRTVAENGSAGTDHGTGGLAILAGGALSGARVHGRWPGLGEGELFDGRDLAPTDDVRRHAAWLAHALFGLERGVLERVVFPGLAMGADPRLTA